MQKLTSAINVLIFFALSAFILANLVRLGMFFLHQQPS